MSEVSTGWMDNGVNGKKPNIFLGIIGAVLGALIGAVLWVIVYQLGYIAWIAGIAIIFCAYKGYSILTKSKDMKGAVIAVIASVLALCLAHWFCWGLDLYNELAVEYEITLLDAIMSIPAIVADPEYTGSFLRDLLIGFVLIAVGFFTYVRHDIQTVVIKQNGGNTDAQQ